MRLKNLGPNRTELVFEDCSIFFSYETPVAAYIRGSGYVRSENFFSVTTSKHINKWLDGREAATVSQGIIEKLLEGKKV